MLGSFMSQGTNLVIITCNNFLLGWMWTTIFSAHPKGNRHYISEMAKNNYLDNEIFQRWSKPEGLEGRLSSYSEATKTFGTRFNEYLIWK